MFVKEDLVNEGGERQPHRMDVPVWSLMHRTTPFTAVLCLQKQELMKITRFSWFYRALFFFPFDASGDLLPCCPQGRYDSVVCAKLKCWIGTSLSFAFLLLPNTIQPPDFG